MERQAPPALLGVLETVLYFEDETETARFYGEVLGMRRLSREPGRSLFFRAGRSVFLLFRARETLGGGALPPHGASGPGHTCFRVPPGEYGRWKDHLTAAGVEIVQEATWPEGRSFYFRDPSGNLLEIADADIWPR